MGSRLRRYLALLDNDSPLKGISARITGDASGDPTEVFSHYAAFAYWVARKIADAGRKRNILDLGSPKTQNAMLSASHNVTSLVLADCSDRFSAVNYIIHDASNPLPFRDGQFDCFTSTVSLPLMGLGRYGDKLDSNSLPNFVRELGRVMSHDADLYVSMCLGPNFLAFNNGWYLDLGKIQTIFSDWSLIETLADSSFSNKKRKWPQLQQRFVHPDTLPKILEGDFWVTFLHFRRQNT